MVAPTGGAVVLVPFPFSDLSQTKLRPAVVLAESSRGDWILCQVTSKPYGDVHAAEMNNDGSDSGAFRVTSYARPGEFFTANKGLMVSQVAILNVASSRTIIEAVIDILLSGLNTPVL